MKGVGAVLIATIIIILAISAMPCTLALESPISPILMPTPERMPMEPSPKGLVATPTPVTGPWQRMDEDWMGQHPLYTNDRGLYCVEIDGIVCK